MRTLKIMGVLGASAILLSASAALAEERTVGVEQKVEVRKEAKAKIEAQREEVKARMEIKHEETKTRIETAREEAKVRMEAQREKAKQRLSDIKDKAKQQKAERIAEQLENLNKKWTDRFAQLLERYGDILLKIQERSNIAAANGKDTTAANAAIQSANSAIATAQTAVTAQAAKTYVLDASSITTSAETTTSSGQSELMKALRTQFQKLQKALLNDLFALRDGAMKDARTAVQSALQALSQIPKVDDDNDSSDNSAQ